MRMFVSLYQPYLCECFGYIFFFFRNAARVNVINLLTLTVLVLFVDLICFLLPQLPLILVFVIICLISQSVCNLNKSVIRRRDVSVGEAGDGRQAAHHGGCMAAL